MAFLMTSLTHMIRFHQGRLCLFWVQTSFCFVLFSFFFLLLSIKLPMIRKAITFQTWCWLTWTLRTKETWLACSPSCGIRTETSSSICGIAVSHHTNISWLFRPSSSYTIPATCTVTSWVFETSFVTELARDTSCAITVCGMKTNECQTKCSAAAK